MVSSLLGLNISLITHFNQRSDYLYISEVDDICW
jgi:hypothetical protein